MEAEPSPADAVAVVAEDPALAPRARALATELALAYAEAETGPWTALLTVAPDAAAPGYRLGLRLTAPDAPGTVYAEFARGKALYRLRRGGGRRQPLARAVGLKHGATPAVVDATGGLGRDAFVLAGLGCPVTVIERSPVVAAVLANGLTRAAAHPQAAAVAARITPRTGDARSLLTQWPVAKRPEVVYLDPMYPARGKQALVKKEMRVLRALVGTDPDVGELLSAALACATRRVVVKRPRHAAPVAGPPPDTKVESENTRYDLYIQAAT